MLDAREDVNNSLKVVKLGLMELPLDRIVGNKEQGRNNAFANNFMPLLDETSEFGVKWSKLYDSFLEEGIRDTIIVYEYLNDYYVQEGNKRVSVAKFGGMEFILADVRRIIPARTDTKEYFAYAEYMDFTTLQKIRTSFFRTSEITAGLRKMSAQTSNTSGRKRSVQTSRPRFSTSANAAAPS